MKLEQSFQNRTGRPNDKSAMQRTWSGPLCGWTVSVEKLVKKDLFELMTGDKIDHQKRKA